MAFSIAMSGLFNSTLPVWGYDAYYSGEGIRISFVPIDFFYKMIILSLGTFRRVLFLTALYLSLALILLIVVLEFAEDKGMPVASWIFCGIYDIGFCFPSLFLLRRMARDAI